MKPLSPTVNTALQVKNPTLDRVYRKVGWRILPLLMAGYMLAYMDRVNISFAKLQMQQDLGMSDAIYGFAAGVFFIGYMIFEVPSNLLLEKIGARKTLSRIMVLWGITSASMFLVHDKNTFYFMRFLLGAFEAGFGPGLLFYLTLWYGDTVRARVMAYVLLASPVAGIIGGPLSTSIMSAMDGVAHLAGWQWLFLTEGTPCVVLGVVAFFYLDDTPQQAKWLSDAERMLLVADVKSGSGVMHRNFGTVLKDPRVYGLAFSYFCMISGLYAVSFWLPTLLRAAGVHSTMAVGGYSSLPYIAAVIAMVVMARHSDRSGERRWHSAVACMIAAVLLAITATTLHSLLFSLSALIVATGAAYAAYTVFWAIPPGYLKGNAAAGGIAFINSLGLLGGFLSPLIIGNLKTWTGSLQSGLLAISAMLAAGAIALVFNRLP